MTSKDRCPKCKGWQVYAEHSLYTDKWRIHCQSCGLSTELYDTWKKARIEWDKDNCNTCIHYKPDNPYCECCFELDKYEKEG